MTSMNRDSEEGSEVTTGQLSSGMGLPHSSSSGGRRGTREGEEEAGGMHIRTASWHSPVGPPGDR